MSPKVNVIARLEFELAYYNVAIHHISHNASLLKDVMLLFLDKPFDAARCLLGKT